MNFAARRMARTNTLTEFQRLMKDIDEKRYAPVYLLEGEEPYFIQAIAERLENEVLTEGEKGFNCTIFYGKETNMVDVVNAARRYPMMSEYQLVFVREAQQISQQIKYMDPLMPYLENPQPQTILVIQHPGRKINRTTRIGKAFKKHEVLTSDKLYENQVMPWLHQLLKEKGLNADNKAIELLVTNSGTNLTRIVNVLNQVAVNVEEGQSISGDEVASFLGIHKEYNIFALQDAIGRKDAVKSMEIVQHIGEDLKANPFPVILINLFNYFKRVYHVHFLQQGNVYKLSGDLGVNPRAAEGYVNATRQYNKAKLDQIFDVLAEFDRRFKSIDHTKASEFELLREMILRIVR